MRNLAVYFVCLFGLSANGANFNCTEIASKPDIRYQVLGEILDPHSITKVKVEIGDKDSDQEHLAIQNDGLINNDNGFQPRNQKLKGYEKFVIEKKIDDVFILFLPKTINTNVFNAYLKLSFDSTYPDLEPLRCELGGL